MKFGKDVWTKIGIVAAVALVIYLIFWYRKRDGYVMYEDSPQDPAEGFAGYEQEGYDGMDGMGGMGDMAMMDDEGGDDGSAPRVENYTLMESTLDDDEANAMFEPGA